jgi:hypothetical protein
VAQRGNDTLVTLDTHDTVLLQNVLATNINASNFLFHVWRGPGEGTISAAARKRPVVIHCQRDIQAA